MLMVAEVMVVLNGYNNVPKYRAIRKTQWIPSPLILLYYRENYFPFSRFHRHNLLTHNQLLTITILFNPNRVKYKWKGRDENFVELGCDVKKPSSLQINPLSTSYEDDDFDDNGS